jgi:acetolactate synthase-1/2/3 large subunit
MSFLLNQKKFILILIPSSINKIIKVDLAIVGDVTDVIKSTTKTLKKKNLNLEKSKQAKNFKMVATNSKMEIQTIS